ncbi:MAG: 50S ribosomal protein L18 [DPANN group archaeon]|nr:50S ribosomal protein L18P [uncultured archaeon]MBS3064249.1 50S ribosomal protein L18 [DPANN group archaeon]
MSIGPRYTVRFRRRREGKTNYHSRLNLLKSRTPRLVARKTNKYIIAQIVTFDFIGDKTVVYANSFELKKHGWNLGLKNTAAAYLVGLLLGKKAVDAGVEKAIFDLGLHRPSKGAKIFATLKGAADAGLNIVFEDKLCPSKDRLSGKHLKSDASADVEKIKGVILN